jgi:hypothetical protein
MKDIIKNFNNLKINSIDKKPKGSLCSINGKKYEKEIHNILKKCHIKGNLFNTQNEKDLGSCSCKNDIICNYQNMYDIGIEIKKSKTPDWMQCSIKYNKENKRWEASKGKNNKNCEVIFNKLINNINLYNDEIPPFMIKPITHEEWLKIKKENKKWNDIYIDIPCNTIRNLYWEKGCKYIQISDGFGLYHLGNDECNFEVPIFEIEQQLRIRTKVHLKKNKKGYCNLSVTISCKPKNIKKLIPSKYSLDNINKLPSNLIYINQ